MNFAYETAGRGKMYLYGVSTYYYKTEVTILELKGFVVFCPFVQLSELPL